VAVVAVVALKRRRQVHNRHVSVIDCVEFRVDLHPTWSQHDTMTMATQAKPLTVQLAGKTCWHVLTQAHRTDIPCAHLHREAMRIVPVPKEQTACTVLTPGACACARVRATTTTSSSSVVGVTRCELKGDDPSVLLSVDLVKEGNVSV
jgi:hypothetical protein